MMSIIIGFLITTGGYFLLKASEKDNSVRFEIFIILGLILLFLGLGFMAYGFPGTKESKEIYESRQIDKDYGTGGFY